MSYEDVVIQDFMDAWFKKDYSKISKDEFTIVYSEYVDTSGLFMSEDFEKKGYVLRLTSRINYVKLFINLQRRFIREFGIPFIRDFQHLKENYGYVLKWENDSYDFEKQLKKVEMREVKHMTLLEAKIKEIEVSRSKNQNKEVETDEETLKKSRTSFIRMINSLRKIGYVIIFKETTVEELALIIKQQTEEVESQKAAYAR